MSVLYILVPLALLIVAGAVWAFVWATRTGQFDDLTTPGVRVLFDDEKGATPRENPRDSKADPDHRTP